MTEKWIKDHTENLEKYDNTWEALKDYEDLQEKLNEMDEEEGSELLINISKDIHGGVSEALSPEIYAERGIQKDLSHKSTSEGDKFYIKTDLLMELNERAKEEDGEYKGITINHYTKSRTGNLAVKDEAKIGSMEITDEDVEINNYNLFKDYASRLEAHEEYKQLKKVEREKEILKDSKEELEEKKKDLKKELEKTKEKLSDKLSEVDDIDDMDESDFNELQEEIKDAKKNKEIEKEIDEIEEDLEEIETSYDHLKDIYERMEDKKDELKNKSDVSESIKKYRDKLFLNGLEKYEEEGEIQEGVFDEKALGGFVGVFKNKDDALDAFEEYEEWKEKKLEDIKKRILEEHEDVKEGDIKSMDIDDLRKMGYEEEIKDFVFPNAKLVRIGREARTGESEITEKVLNGEIGFSDTTKYYGDDAEAWWLDTLHDMDIAYKVSEAYEPEEKMEGYVADDDRAEPAGFGEKVKDRSKLPIAAAGGTAILLYLAEMVGAAVDPESELAGGIGPVPGRVVERRPIEAELNETDIVGNITEGEFSSDGGNLNLSAVEAFGNVTEEAREVTGTINENVTAVMDEDMGTIYLPKRYFNGTIDGNVTYEDHEGEPVNRSVDGNVSGNISDAEGEIEIANGTLKMDGTEFGFELDRRNNSLVIDDGRFEGEYQGMDVDDFVANIEATLKETEIHGNVINEDPLWSNIPLYATFGLLGGLGLDYTKRKINKGFDEQDEILEEQDKTIKEQGKYLEEKSNKLSELEAAKTETVRAGRKSKKYEGLEKESLPTGQVLEELEENQ